MSGETGKECFKFTGPERFDRAIHTLEGLLTGISIDEKITPAEYSLLRNWCIEHRDLIDRHPYDELIVWLEQSLDEGYINSEMQEDVLWLINNYSEGSTYRCAVALDLQKLRGIVAGIVADGVIEKDELTLLSGWMESHEHLKGVYPYDEIYSLITEVLADGRIDAKEHELLLAFFSDFLRTADDQVVTCAVDLKSLGVFGVCACEPDIDFAGKTFCVTGISEDSDLKKIQETVEELGGEYRQGMGEDVDFLIVSAEGNPCWVFSCFGKKVEKALEMRKAGGSVQIILEADFWDSVEDFG